MLAALIISRVLTAIGKNAGIQPLDHRIEIVGRRIEGHHQRADLGAEEMIWAAGAEIGQRLEVATIDEVQDHRLIVEMTDLALTAANAGTDLRHQARDDTGALSGRQRSDGGATENRLALRLFGKPADRLVDDAQSGFIAVAGGFPPGQQAMGLQHHALGLRIGLGESGEVETELESRSPPGQPADLVAEDLGGQRLAVLRGSNRNHRIGMHVIDMAIGEIGMQRRIDRGRARVEVEGAMRQIADHLVFMSGAAIDLPQLQQLLHIERRKAIELHGADIAARALDPEHISLGTTQRIGQQDFGRGIAAAVIGDALIGAQQIGAIKQAARLIQ